MEIGVVTYEPEVIKGFDINIYYVKRADGSIFQPAEQMFNDVTCFCDAKAIRKNPGMVAISKDGPALRNNRKVNMPWDYLCPTEESYKKQLLELIDDLGNRTRGVILNLYHFPEEGFCTCSRCQKLWHDSGLEWTNWRVKIVTDFIAEAGNMVKGTFATEIWPDPVLSKERFGVDFGQIAKYIDFFHIPLSANDYTTMYWVDMLTRIFTRILQKPVYIELSAELPNDMKLEALLKTMAYVSRHNVKGIFLLVHDVKNAEQVCKYAIQNKELQKWFETHGFHKMLEIIEKWKEFY